MELENYKIWKEYINSKLEGDKVFLEILDIFKDSDFPIIFDVNHFCDYLKFDSSIINEILYDSEKFYRSFEIPKRKGGIRVIKTPYPSLKYIQRWINSNILSKCETHYASMAFSKGKSIINNVSPHIGSKTLLKLDIKDFFPSVGFKQIYPIYKSIGYSKRVAYSLSKICLCEESLPQGAPTSPVLSNIVLFNLDKRLASLSKRFSYNYTRYADDLTFSGEDIPWRFSEYVIDILESEGFEANKSKTKLITTNKKIITGISITNNRISLPRKTKREYRASAYNILKINPTEYLATFFIKDPVHIDRVLGKFNFWLMVEPENEYIKETIKKLHQFNKELLSI